MAWLAGKVQEFIDQGDVLVFANQKARVDELTAKLKAAGVRSVILPAYSGSNKSSRMSSLC